MRKRTCRFSILLFVLISLLTIEVFAAGITGIVIPTRENGNVVEYEYVVNSWRLKDTGPDSEVITGLVNPIGLDSLFAGQSKEISLKETYTVSTEIGYEQTSKLSSGIDIPTKVLSLKLQAEFNSKVYGKKTESYTKEVSHKENYAFDNTKAQAGYNSCIIYGGIHYNTCMLRLAKYKVRTETYRRWFLGKKRKRKVRGDFVGYVEIEAKQPYIVMMAKYYKASLKSTNVTGKISSNPSDTEILYYKPITSSTRRTSNGSSRRGSGSSSSGSRRSTGGGSSRTSSGGSSSSRRQLAQY